MTKTVHKDIRGRERETKKEEMSLTGCTCPLPTFPRPQKPSGDQAKYNEVLIHLKP